MATKTTTLKVPTRTPKKGTTSKKAAKKSARQPAANRPISPRQEKFVEGVLRHGNKTRAAREAGYSDPNAQATRVSVNVGVQARIRQRIQEAQVETNEVLGTLVSQMRADIADILPDDEFLQQARERGVSHLIKELKITKRVIPAEVNDEGEMTMPVTLETKYELKIHDSQAAAKQLCHVFGLEKLPAPSPETLAKLEGAVEQLIAKAAEKGIVVSPETARAKLMPYFESETEQ